MLERSRFDLIKETYAYWGSWAVWAEEGGAPKSNVGDLSVLDPDVNRHLLSQLNPNVVLVGLNISIRAIEDPITFTIAAVFAPWVLLNFKADKVS